MAYTSLINAVIGGSDANSYSTVAEATSYLERTYGAASWADLGGGLLLERRELLLMTATRLIDRGGPWARNRYFYPNWSVTKYPYEGQGLEFPRDDHKSLIVDASGGTTTTFVLATLPDGHTLWTLAGGSLIVTAGTNLGQHRRITSYASSTGTITVDTAFTSAIDSTSSAYLIWPFSSGRGKAVLNATIEQAWSLWLENQSNESVLDELAAARSAGLQSGSIGGTSFTLTNVGTIGGFMDLCPNAQQLLAPYRAEVRLWRA